MAYMPRGGSLFYISFIPQSYKKHQTLLEDIKIDKVIYDK